MPKEAELRLLADAKKLAHDEYHDACIGPPIARERYDELRERYIAAMKAHHEALGYA